MARSRKSRSSVRRGTPASLRLSDGRSVYRPLMAEFSTRPRQGAWSLYPGHAGLRRFVPVTHRGRPAPVSTRIHHRSLLHVESFKTPSSVLVCARRKIRREVLLATGRGGGRHRRPKRTASSSVRCR